jgi:hypothetical protein
MVDFPVNHGADYRRICVMSFTANFAARESQWAQHHGKKSNVLPTFGVHWHLIWNIPTLRLRLKHRMGRWHVDRCSKVPKKDPKGMAHHQRPDNTENVRKMKCWTVRTRNDVHVSTLKRLEAPKSVLNSSIPRSSRSPEAGHHFFVYFACLHIHILIYHLIKLIACAIQHMYHHRFFTCYILYYIILYYIILYYIIYFIYYIFYILYIIYYIILYYFIYIIHYIYIFCIM